MERPKLVLRADERMVLQSLFLDRENSAEVLHELKSIESLSRLASRRVFQAVFAQDAASSDPDGISFDRVNARLEEGDRQLLAEAVLREDTASSRDEVMAAIASLRRAETQDQRKDIKLRIKDLERGGKWDDALRLTAELQDLERKARGAR